MNDPMLLPLRYLTRRIRWKRWLTQTHTLLWVLAGCVLLAFGVDFAFGLNNLALRIVAATLALATVTLLVVGGVRAWFAPLDVVGLAHLLETKHPELAERLITLVQLPADDASRDLVELMKAQTERTLRTINVLAACPLDRERRLWTRSTLLLAAVFGVLLFVPSFPVFAQRLATAWITPLVPYRIALAHGSGYALRGGSYAIEAQVHVVDPHAEHPTNCDWVVLGEDGIELRRSPMESVGQGRYAISLESLREPAHGCARVGPADSGVVSIDLIDPPSVVGRPTALVVPPSYVKTGAKTLDLDDEKRPSVLQYSRLAYQIRLTRASARATLSVTTIPTSDKPTPVERSIPLACLVDGSLKGEEFAVECGDVHATLALTLEHGVKATLPIGRWRVHADKTPSFTPLRFHGSATPLLSSQEHSITPEDALKLQTDVTDDEGLDGVALEFRVNGKAQPVKPWLRAVGGAPLRIDHWLPLPRGLKDGDRVEFRLHASDRRSLKKGSVIAVEQQPRIDLGPQMTIAPASTGEDGDWIHLRIEKDRNSFAKQQAQAQRDDTRDLISKIKAKIAGEAQQIDALKRLIHRQAALTQEQRREAEALRGLNRSISEDLLRASEQTDLAKLAGHFLDLADNELQKSDDALKRVTGGDRSLAEAEADLAEAIENLNAAQRKLERMLEWNDQLARDRVDQAQIESLAKRQQELADRLEKLRASEAPSEADRARQIEEIRQEQAKLAAEAERLQQNNKLVQESMAALEQKRAADLAMAADKLRAEQQAMRELTADKLSPEAQERLDQLIKRQTSLADRVEPFAAKNDGPKLTPARAAAQALVKLKIEDAITQQKAHEGRLRGWTVTLFPDEAIREMRSQVMALLQKQKGIRSDLEKLGRDLPQLDDKTVQERFLDVLARERAVLAALGELKVRPSERAAHETAFQVAQIVVDQLVGKNALTAAEAMQKTEQDLAALANLLPMLSRDRSDIKDPLVRGRVEQIDRFHDEQVTIRVDTERLLSDLLKASAEKGGGGGKEKAQQLAKDLLELGQQGMSPEAKAMGKEGAESLDMAQKAMQSSEDAKAKGDAEAAKKFDDEAAKQLEIVAQKLMKFAQDQAMKPTPKDAGKTADAVKESNQQMKIAEAKLPNMTKEAQAAMQAAADKLNDAVDQAVKQSQARLPAAARNPTTQAKLFPGRGSSPLPKDVKLDPELQKKWGDLPGELKTQMIQDLRARYGDEYASLIQQYFERVAQSQTPARKE